MIQLDKTQIAYAAGVIDGEGSLTIHRNANRPKWAGKSAYWYDAELVVTNSELKIVKLFQSWFGGTIAEDTSGNRLGKRIIYRWRLRDRVRLVEVLQALKPFLFLKQQQAEILISFLMPIVAIYNSSFSQKHVSSEEWERRDKHYWQIRKSNHYLDPQRLSEIAEAEHASEAIV